MGSERFWKGVSVLHAHARPLLPALVLLVPLLPMTMDATQRASLTTLGRDQGIFQYVGWALLKGEVDYRDVRDVNGPLTHLVHIVLQLLGGRDEHRFRVLDLLFTGIAFAIVGACLPGIGRVKKGRPSSLAEGSVTWVARIGWAGAAWVVLSAQMLMYLYWDLAQRETFFAWFLLPGIGLQLVAQERLRKKDTSGKWLLGVAGALLAIPVFGKPTYALFVLAQLLTLLIDDDMVLTRKQRFAPFAIGGVIGALTQIGFLLRFGDIRAFARITFHDVPLAYRFIMTRTPREILALQWGGPVSMIALATGLVIIALIVDGMMPRRALGIALLPICAVVSVLVQSKGFPYHFHPVSAGLYLQFLALTVWGWERFADAPRGVIHRVAPLAGALAIAWRLSNLLPQSPHILDTWILEKGTTPELRASHDYLVYFRDRDFFPWEIRQAAEYLKEHTAPTDRVQIYGMDPYVLFLAERLSATPYIYSYDLNADAALQGSWLPEGPHPTPDQAREIKGMRDEHELDLLARVQKQPPAAFVFFDNAPLVSWQDAVYDFHEQCAVAASWVDANYRFAAQFKEIRVYLRNDLADGVAGR